MFITAKLVFESYMTDTITKGMWFKQRIKDVIYGKIYQYDRIFELSHTPQDIDSYLSINGYPVKPVIMSITANPDEKAVVLATDDKIGWWDEDPDNDEQDLRDIELKDINLLLSDFDGEIDIQVNHTMFEQGIIQPIIYYDKVTLSFPTEKDNYPTEHPDDYEDWDDMDDEPEEDSAGFTSEDRYDPYDYETE